MPVRHPASCELGYVSPTFGEHPVGRFSWPLLSHHDRSRFEIALLHRCAITDALTERLNRSHRFA